MTPSQLLILLLIVANIALVFVANSLVQIYIYSSAALSLELGLALGQCGAMGVYLARGRGPVFARLAATLAVVAYVSVCSLAVYANFDRLAFSLTLARLALAQIALVVVVLAVRDVVLGRLDRPASDKPGKVAGWVRFTTVDLAAAVTYGVVALGAFRPGAFGMGDFFPRDLSRAAAIVAVFGWALGLSLISVGFYLGVCRRGGRPAGFQRTVIWILVLTPAAMLLLPWIAGVVLMPSPPVPNFVLVLSAAAATNWVNMRIVRLAADQTKGDPTREPGRSSSGE